MRLSDQEIFKVKKLLEEYNLEYELYLHGSRIDDSKKGGDIDLFVAFPDLVFKELVQKKYIISSDISLALNEQKVDIIFLPYSEKKSHTFFLNSQKLKL